MGQDLHEESLRAGELTARNQRSRGIGEAQDSEMDPNQLGIYGKIRQEQGATPTDPSKTPNEGKDASPTNGIGEQRLTCSGCR